MTPPVARYGPPVMAVAWDAYTSDDTLLFSTFLPSGANATRLFSEYGHRRPTPWQNYRQWGAGVDAQAVCDAGLLEISHPVLGSAFDWLQYDWYPPPSCFSGDPGNMPTQSGLMTMFECHRTSAYKANAKFGFMIDPGWWKYGTSLPGDWSRTTAFRAHLLTAMADSQYMRVQGMPVLGVYAYQNYSAPDKATWLAEVDYIASQVGPLYILVQNHNATTRADHLSHAGRLSLITYGPNPALTGTGQQAWEVQRASDVAQWPSAGGGQFISTTITPSQDGRPLGASDGTRPWMDLPSMPALQAHISAAMTFTQSGIPQTQPDLVSYHSWSENTETGPGIIPTIQEKRRFLDAMLWARTGKWPPFYSYALGARGLTFTKTGTWAVSAQTFGMFDGVEVSSTTTSDKVEFTHERCLHLGVLATKGPDRGIANIYISQNGGAFTLAGTADLYSASVQYQQEVFMSARLSGGTCAIRVEVSGTKNASSSSNKVGYEACRIVYVP